MGVSQRNPTREEIQADYDRWQAGANVDTAGRVACHVPYLLNERKELYEFLAGSSLCPECQKYREARAIIATPRIQVEEERDQLREALATAQAEGRREQWEEDYNLWTQSRDTILHGLDGFDNDQTNEALGVLDDHEPRESAAIDEAKDVT